MATPQIQRAVLVIADIGGYTRFMKLTRMNLAHAQQVVADLLIAVIDAAVPLELAKLEGDAALLWAPMSEDPKHLRELSAAVLRIRSAFLGKRTQMVTDNTCTCESCQQIENLNLKFVAHEGEVALQKVKRNTELAGVDVILVHRMLKNNVPISEYVLMTDAVLTALPEELKSMAQTLDHDFEGLGEVKTHFVDLTKVPLPPPPEPKVSFFRRVWRTISVNTAAFPSIVGISKPLVGYEKTRESITPP